MRIKELLNTQDEIEAIVSTSIYVCSFDLVKTHNPSNLNYLTGEYSVETKDGDDFSLFLNGDVDEDIAKEYGLICKTFSNDEDEKGMYIPRGSKVIIKKNSYSNPCIYYKDLVVEFYDYSSIHRYIET